MRYEASLILLYHRVAEEKVDPIGMCVSPAHFEEHLDALQNGTQVVPASRIGEAPPRSVAITFDDGYADVFTEALPRLARRGIPSAVFLVTQALEDGSAYWWDRLVAAIYAEKRAEPLRAGIHGRARTFGWGHDVSRRVALRILFRRFRSMSPDEREQAIAEMEDSSTSRVLQLPAVATLDDVRAVCGELVEIGSHTCTHPRLSGLGPADRSAEIAGSKRLLEERLGVAVRAFAYPFGARGTFDAAAVTEVKNAGYACAFTNIPGSYAGDDLFTIPRRVVGNWSGAVFERRLKRWLRSGSAPTTGAAPRPRESSLP